ncbi:hypothetical protein K7I13_12100 [Brucepastera parasyntrophica]|uniref:hypothetical protein n=1 Tax=Brucepastera parasyntrophica TaxID=2880008 RepID=UPI00210EDF0B|nr:hypothetical protein [Brucepastera parasyntrophica]ULQ59228.1 hypothetical protein K7I13_12100 [Brucepastera parasyntrophica]
MGRPRKPTAQLKLTGTYRADRHEKNIDDKLPQLITFASSVTVPESLTDKYVRAAFSSHTDMLISLQILHISDLPEIENMYIILQELRRVRKHITDIKSIAKKEDFERYNTLNYLAAKLTAQFSSLAAKYFISPHARNKLTLEAYEIAAAQKRTGEPPLIERLVKGKKC